MITIGDKDKKYCIQVMMMATASNVAANIYCDTKEEYENLLNDNLNDIYNESHLDVNCHNNFDMGDGELEEVNFDKDKDYYKNT